jgi:protein-disulfide isomerase
MFWEMRDLLYRRQRDLYTDPQAAATALAGELGMDRQAFGDCLANGTHRQFVLDDYAAAQAEGVRSRPEFRLADQRLVGALPYAQFKERIEAQLAAR